MSTLVTEEHKAGATAEASPSMFANLLRWYRNAVTAPETEQEKAEWQQDSF